MVFGLYIHIPFCTVKCRYCDFAVYPGLRHQTADYLQALHNEMAFFSESAIDTIFVGGGTPSLLSSAEWSSLTQALKNNFNWQKNFEFSVEVNPETLDQEQAQSFLSNGVSRLSLGLQSVHNAFLKQLGRTHTYSDFLTAWQTARRVGFSNLNLDLIYGLPHQTLAQWQESLDRVLELRPEHLSAYALSVEKKSAFYYDGVQTDADQAAAEYELLCQKMQKAGYVHYEISNFSLPGFECRHNLKYWRNQPTLALGVSAASFDGQTRRKNFDRIPPYLEALAQGKRPIAESETLTEVERYKEALMLRLRLKEGAQISPEMWLQLEPAFTPFLQEGLLQKSGDNISITERGWLLSNAIFIALLSAELVPSSTKM